MLVRSLVWLCALITRMAVLMSHNGSTRVRLHAMTHTRCNDLDVQWPLFVLRVVW